MNQDNLMKAIGELHRSVESSSMANDLLMEILTAAMGSNWGTIGDKNDLSNATALFWSISKLIEAAEPFRDNNSFDEQ
jgi:hypothetical protein